MDQGGLPPSPCFILRQLGIGSVRQSVIRPGGIDVTLHMSMERALIVKAARPVRAPRAAHRRKPGLMAHDPSWGSDGTTDRRPTPIVQADPAAMALLIEAIAKRKDKTAFASLFGYYAPRLKSYLRRLRVEDRQAEDLAQDVMLTVWRKADLFDPEKASVGTWIFTIARNRFIDAKRREKRPELDPDDPALQPETPRGADAEVAASEIGIRVRAALSTLPPDQAQVVALSFLEALPHSEIATRLSIPLGTVKSRLRLAFARLRSALEDMQ